MRLYNALTKEIENFVPNQEKVVKMYTCGPTVYNYAHIGNLRTYIFEDVLEKSLGYLGYEVKRVMNITDVGHMTSDADEGEDKMLKGAEREGKSPLQIADFYADAFFDDFEKLNIRKPDIVEKASVHIDEYIKIIEKLIEDDYAYVADNGNVYFDISKKSNYYQLSGKKENDLMIGVREDVEKDIHKRNPFDFVLWFVDSKYKNHELQWDSPWGSGYPGWHIECSAIAIKYLGKKLDIHCGGVDLAFPHHTNEIAQSEAYLGHKWCNYWVYGEFLNDLTGKMGKSKGQFMTLSLLESKGYDPLAYRFLCLQSHYRNQLVFSYEALDVAANAYQKLKNKIKAIVAEGNSLDDKQIAYYKDKLQSALKEDLNTANAITCLFTMIKDNSLNNDTKLYLVKNFDQVLSLDLLKEELVISEELEKDINKQIGERDKAKKKGDYQQADKIREKLKTKGIIIKDTRTETTWEIIK